MAKRMKLSERKAAALERLRLARDGCDFASASIDDFLRGDKALTVKNLRDLEHTLYMGETQVSDAIAALEN